MSDVYTRLAQHLDSLPAGFPATQNGVELKILQKLFTSQEAEIASQMSMMPDSVEKLAQKMDMDPSELAPLLENMAQKGLIFRYRKKGTPYYMAAQFVIGIWEYHVNDLDEELIELVNEYAPDLMRTAWERTRTKQLRVIPISEEVEADTTVMPYDQAENIITAQTKIAVAPCICRRERSMVGEGCDNPQETCLVFGGAADFYLENGLAREIDQQEALRILEVGRQAGLVLQPGNAQKPASMCMCCGCCCQILRNLKRMEKPSHMVHTNFVATVNPEACTGCGVCRDRCHMEAITVDDVARVDPERCIGCGVCVPGCEFEAISMQAKDAQEVYEPPKNVIETYMSMAQERMSNA